MKRLPIILLSLEIAACSNRAIYDNIRIHQRNECLKEPPSRHKECMERANKSYEEYERERRDMKQFLEK